MSAPFTQMRFEELPALPRRPHAWLEVPHRRVTVWTEAFGHTETPVRVLGSGPPLLLLHGLMTTHYSWRYAAPMLAERFTVYVPDLLGAGDASAPRRAPTPERMADWLAALVESLELRSPAVIGNSMGAYLTMWTSLRHPRAFSRQVALHGPGVPTARMWALWAAMRVPGAPSLLAWLSGRDPERWAHHNVHYWDESLKSLEEARAYGAPLATPEGRAAFAAAMKSTLDAAAMRRFTRALRSRRDEGCSFPVPLMLVYAKEDPMVPPSVGRALAELVPEAPIAWMKDASHFAHVDAVDRFVPLVADWLAGD